MKTLIKLILSQIDEKCVFLLAFDFLCVNTIIDPYKTIKCNLDRYNRIYITKTSSNFSDFINLGKVIYNSNPLFLQIFKYPKPKYFNKYIKLFR